MNFNDRIFSELAIINTDIKLLIREVATLKVKASIWGGVAGIVASIPALIYMFLKFGEKITN